jgi:hypothetical protein
VLVRKFSSRFAQSVDDRERATTSSSGVLQSSTTYKSAFTNRAVCDRLPPTRHSSRAVSSHAGRIVSKTTIRPSACLLALLFGMPQRKSVGRQRRYIAPERIQELRLQGLSFRQISRATGFGYATIPRAYSLAVTPERNGNDSPTGQLCKERLKASLAMSGPLRNVPGVKNSLFRHAEEVYSLASSCLGEADVYTCGFASVLESYPWKVYFPKPAEVSQNSSKAGRCLQGDRAPHD